MQEIEQHQRRLATALLRIGAAFERLAEPPPAARNGQAEARDAALEVELAALRRALDEARAEVASLSEQLRGTHATLEEVVLELSAQIEARDLELSELRAGLSAEAGESAAQAALTAELDALRAEAARERSAFEAEIAALGARASEPVAQAPDSADFEAIAAELAEARAEADALRVRLSSTIESHQGATATLEQVILSLTSQIEARDADLAQLRAHAADAVSHSGLEARATAAESHAAALADELDALRSSLADTGALEERARASEARADTLAADLAALRSSAPSLEDFEAAQSLAGEAEARARALAEELSRRAPANSEESEHLRRKLADAEAHGVELSERLGIMEQRQAQTSAALEARIAALNEQLETQTAEMARLRDVNIRLREAMGQLREGMAAGLIAGESVNQALLAELAALTTARDFERAELDSLIRAINPLIGVEETADA